MYNYYNEFLRDLKNLFLIYIEICVNVVSTCVVTFYSQNHS